MYNSKLAMNFDTYLGDSVTKSVNLNPYAKCYKPILTGDNDFHLSMETTVTPVTPNVTDSSISINETNLGTNRGTVDGDAGNSDVYSIINKLRIGNANRIIIAHLNINSIRNKIDMLSTIVSNKIDILCIAETKLDDTFPLSNFLISGFSPPYRLDRSSKGGGILVYVRSDIPSKELKSIPIPKCMECVCFEINLYKKNGFWETFIIRVKT